MMKKRRKKGENELGDKNLFENDKNIYSYIIWPDQLD